MFAMRLKRNVFQQHQLVIAAHFFKGARQVDCRIVGIAAAIFLPRPRHALRRIEQSFARWIVAGPLDQRPYRLRDMVGNDHLAVGSQFNLVVAHCPAFTVAFLPHISVSMPR